MASQNSSQARVFASATARAVARLASRYLSATSGVLQANHSRLDSFSLTASLTAGVHHQVQRLPPQQAPQTLQPQLQVAASTIQNMVHSDSMSPTCPRIWSKLSRRCEFNTSLAEGPSLHPSVQDIRPKV
ncbi:hypothetical protein ATANTOWER_026310 [Ataeniobius toweri]|uniref:Uncharacterized protein n=1 Tax=Ataeniobius toweri TaxID=208326 RepID=A0ABU7A8H2_9TELE|nr:hypothetical protein [Ataeniobius toweri]